MGLDGVSPHHNVYFRKWLLQTALIVAHLLVLHSAAQAAEVQPMQGLTADRYIELKYLSAFTWDEHGTVWTLSEQDRRLALDTIPKPGEIKRIGSFERRGNERASLLVHANHVFVSDGNAIRTFLIREQKFISEQTLMVAAPDLFPKQMQITSLGWSPLGHISFFYRAEKENGIGRLDIRRERWDVVAKGLSGDLAYDPTGFPVVSDETSAHLFRLRLGLDYEHGLHGFTKKDLALTTDKPGLKPAAISIHPGGVWPEENRDTFLVFDRATSRLQQFKEKEERLTHWRDLAHWSSTVSHVDLQFGPDGALWLLSIDQNESGSIHRLFPTNVPAATNSFPNIPALETTQVVELFRDSNSWTRETALRVLDDREELRQARGLHPSDPLHRLYDDTNAPTLARLHALLSLHRVELLDEVTVESASTEVDPALRTWAALLFGERNYPTGTAFEMLMKHAKGTNLNVRMAATIAARQFVSSSLALDTTPRAMPIREVWTGGLLSTLWFSTQKSHSPAFDLLYWNAVKPISAFDSAHPLGFFTEATDEPKDSKNGVPITYWTVGLIGEQIAEQDHPLKQEDAMRMMSELKQTRLILAALQGLKKGTARQRVVPTEKSLKVLKDFSQRENREIATLANEILDAWQQHAQR